MLHGVEGRTEIQCNDSDEWICCQHFTDSVDQGDDSSSSRTDWSECIVESIRLDSIVNRFNAHKIFLMDQLLTPVVL